MKRVLLPILLFALLLSFAYAEEIAVSLTSGSTVTSGDPFTFDVTMPADVVADAIHMVLSCTPEGWVEANKIYYDGETGTFAAPPLYAQGAVGECTAEIEVSGHGTTPATEYFDVSSATVMDLSAVPGEIGFYYDTQSASVYRLLPEPVFPGGTFRTDILVYPYLTAEKEPFFTGMVIRETLPAGTTLGDPALISENVQGNYTYDPDTRQLKFVLMDADYIGYTYLYYPVVPLAGQVSSGSTLVFSGDWVITGENFETIGDSEATVGGVDIPQCPLSDEALVGYIEQWAKAELSPDLDENDLLIMQILEVWKGC